MFCVQADLVHISLDYTAQLQGIESVRVLTYLQHSTEHHFYPFP